MRVASISGKSGCVLRFVTLLLSAFLFCLHSAVLQVSKSPRITICFWCMIVNTSTSSTNFKNNVFYGATTRFSPESVGCQKQTAPSAANNPIRWAVTSQAFTRWRHRGEVPVRTFSIWLLLIYWPRKDEMTIILDNGRPTSLRQG